MSSPDATSSPDVASADRDEPTLKVGEVADRVRLSHRTVRYYDDEGLLTAARSAGNYRLYAERDVERLLLIRVLKPLGYTLEEMRELLHLVATLEDPEHRPTDREREELETFTVDVKRRRDRLAEQLAAADDFYASLEGRLG